MLSPSQVPLLTPSPRGTSDRVCALGHRGGGAQASSCCREQIRGRIGGGGEGESLPRARLTLPCNHHSTWWARMQIPGFGGCRKGLTWLLSVTLPSKQGPAPFQFPFQSFPSLSTRGSQHIQQLSISLVSWVSHPRLGELSTLPFSVKLNDTRYIQVKATDEH